MGKTGFMFNQTTDRVHFNAEGRVWLHNNQQLS